MTINPNITPEPEQPHNAVHVPDPRGIYVGFWLTPEQAMMVGEMRVKKRLDGNNEANVNLAAFNFDIMPRKWRGKKHKKRKQND